MWPALALIFLATLVAGTVYWRGQLAAARRALEDASREAAQLHDEQRAALAHEEARRQALFNSLVEGVLILDSDGRVQLINQSLRGLLEPSGDVHGRTLLEAFRLAELQQIAERAVHEGPVVGAELELPRLDRRALQVNAVALRDPEGRVAGTVLVFHDLTRLRELENTRREFVANVSHELRTPLSMIKGYAETLLDGAKDDPEVATRFLRTIDKHADRLSYLIEDLLTLSRLESGQAPLNVQPTDLRATAQSAVEDLADRAAKRPISLVNRIDENLMVRADGDRLQQVFFNLVDNAIKYGKPEGSVIISASTLPDGVIEVAVLDDGPGIPPDAIGRIFERFFRVDRARSREEGGTGLGLAIVKHIVQAHGGQVRATSEPGNGARMYFTLSKA
jgi:two-component system phosphate regulon sensor histidine kinase PhoR